MKENNIKRERRATSSAIESGNGEQRSNLQSNHPASKEIAQLQRKINKRTNVPLQMIPDQVAPIQLWSIRHQNLDTGAVVRIEKSPDENDVYALRRLTIEALEEIVDNGFMNVQLAGDDADAGHLQELARGVLEAKKSQAFTDQAREPQGRPPKVQELEDLEDQISLPLKYGGLGPPDPRLDGMEDHYMSSATNVSLIQNGIHVYLDIDQLKHQDKSQPIGLRQASGGNKFDPSNSGSIAWHKANTLKHMLEWAKSCPKLRIGQQIYHGQGRPVDGIHYEGYLVKMPDGKKLVIFHCYPSDSSPYKL